MHVRGFLFFLLFFIVFLHCSTCFACWWCCLFNTFRQGQKLHAFFPRKCVLGPLPPFSPLGGDGGDV